MKWGFVGLGQMGLPMARNLSAVADVTVYDRKGRRFDGLTISSDADDLKGVEALLTCLPDGDVVETVLFDNPALADGLQEGAVVVDTSTTSHGAAVRIGERLSARGIAFLDAPVSGMQKRAEDGTLTMMVGGDAAMLERCRADLGSMASRVLHLGPQGAGQLGKLVNQLLFNINMAGLAEIMPIAARLGLDPEQITQIVNSGTGRSYASEFFLPNILQGVFDQGYPMRAAHKDMIAGADVTRANAFPAPVLAAATATYEQALAKGHGEKDKGAMILVFEELLNTSFRAKGKA